MFLKIRLTDDDLNILLYMFNIDDCVTTTDIARNIWENSDLQTIRRNDIKVRRILKKLESLGLLESEKIKDGKMTKKIYKIKQENIGIGNVNAKINLIDKELEIRIKNVLALKMENKWFFIMIE